MAETRRQSIADDWLEVESAASVVSLPTSDGEDDLYDWSRSASPSAPLLHPDASRAESPVASTSPLKDPTDDRSPTPHHEPAAIDDRSPTPQHEAATKEKDVWSTSEEESDGQNGYATLNPSDCHKACCEAAKSLDVVASLAHDLGGVEELEKMTATYAKHWADNGSNMTTDDMPINADIFDWVSHLRNQLLRAEGEMRSLIPQDDPDSPPFIVVNSNQIPLKVNMALATCVESLEGSHAVFAEFLPILKADYNEFCTQWMNFPKKPVEEAQTQTHREPPHPTICRIRRALYDLKDRMQLVSNFLAQLHSSVPQPRITDPSIVRSLDNIVGAISTILTNHASEWIDSDLTSVPHTVISYPQFLTLDPEILHDITMHLEKFQNELDIDSAQESYLYSPEMIRNHQDFMLLEGGQLQELRSIIEFLESLLIDIKV
ncbi:hypothetical protein NM208_g12673 [Fusarium decemcellulare]|uniref:Uncharacterized protein n=1 Tax=Fusarium decemcellulare TaxID=57161 RepID=A0ACC1RMQ4_9HYPO|nr:hypothetical protein NM208_g12673 [Fusarium decemcellulare]